MITLLIAEDEAKIKDFLARVLKTEGYQLCDSSGADSSVKIVRKGCASMVASLQDKIFELEDSLLKDKHGVLYKSLLEAVEKPIIEHVLQKTEGNQLKAARILGINRNTIRTKIRRLGIDVRQWKNA